MVPLYPWTHDEYLDDAPDADDTEWPRVEIPADLVNDDPRST